MIIIYDLIIVFNIYFILFKGHDYIKLVVCNLYPFEKTISSADVTTAQVLLT